MNGSDELSVQMPELTVKEDDEPDSWWFGK